LKAKGAQVVVSFSIPAATAVALLTDLKIGYQPQLVVSNVGSDPTTLTGLPIASELEASPDRLTPTQQTVVLRVLQEALQNVRKHGAASAATVASAIEGADWVLTVRDDGRGFDVGAVAARGRRNFGLQFMRERAELIGARFEVHSRPDGGTLVRPAIPVGAEENGS